MKKLSKTKAICVVLTVILLASIMLTACGSDSGNKAAPTAVTGDGPDWAADTTPVTLTWYDNTVQTQQFDPVNNPVDKIIQEKTGVTIKFVSPPEESYDKLNAMVSSDSLPDIVTISYDVTIPTFPTMESAGLLYPVMDLVDKYAPDFKSIIPQSMIDYFKYSDGKLYGVQGYYTAPEEAASATGFKYYTSAGLLARKDIMSKLGIKQEDFNTKAGFEAALLKVKNSNLKDNNGKPITPLVMGDTVVDQVGMLAGMFGDAEEAKDGSLIQRETSPIYLEALKYTNKLFNEGLISSGNLTSSAEQTQEQALAGSVFCYMGNIMDFRGASDAVYAADNKMQYVPVGPIKGDEGLTPIFSSQNTVGWQMNMITKKCKYPDRAIRLFEFLASEEGQKLTQFGIEGKSYTVNSDGKFEFTKAYTDARTKDAETAKKEYGVGKYLYFKDPVYVFTHTADPTDASNLQLKETRDYFSQYVQPDRLFSANWPQPGTDEDSIGIEIANYQPTFLPKIVVAKASQVEPLWKQMIAHEKELGLDRFNKVCNDIFQSYKKKAGVKFAMKVNGGE